MKMKNTRVMLTAIESQGDRSTALSLAKQEVAGAEELAAMIRKVCEAHWGACEDDSANSRMTMRTLVRQAEALLAKVGG